jgi:ribose transport system permease protein
MRSVEPTVSDPGATPRPVRRADAREPNRRVAVLRRASDLRSHAFAQYGLVFVFAVIVAIFSIAEPDTFFTAQNAKTIAAGKAVVAILALAAMLPLVVGQFDLSVGFQMGLSQTLCAGLILKQGLPAGAAIGIVLIEGVVFGLVNGLLIVRLRINAFIATLGTGTLATGFSQWYSKGESLFGSLPGSFTALGRNDLGGIPLPIVYVAILVVVLWLALEFTAWGRECFAIGGNARAALIAGVRVERLTLQTFAATGLLCSLAGVLSVAMLGSANPDVGPNLLLPAFAGAFLGATSIRPGRYNAWGTFLAVYLLAAGITGLQQLGAAFYIEQFFNGGALLVAVAVSGFAASRRRARLALSHRMER